MIAGAFILPLALITMQPDDGALPPDGAAPDTEAETISAGEAWQGELKNLKKNGEPYWVIASISPLRDGGTAYTGSRE